ncbi:hypothetical protein DFQ27_006225 [Actinomortierella ambigua]|uniref:Uncharacterized protein n=1 Tax=Actinomortierella ambigua TaxID=1343610 RepID=A0A9P6U1S7_9FUNG|nr:hypothetical protein DFQ27_006225 [Actinomortierella ambigua]
MEKHRHLYDIDTVALWTPNDSVAPPSSTTADGSSASPYADAQDAASSTANAPMQLDALEKQTKRRIAYWKQWFLRQIAANISPLFLTTTVPSGLASTVSSIKSSWQISLSPDTQLLAVNQEDKIEFRPLHSAYQLVQAAYVSPPGTPKDLYPKWRRIAWSLDSRLVARSFSDGTIEIIDARKGSLIGCIVPMAATGGAGDDGNNGNNGNSNSSNSSSPTATAGHRSHSESLYAEPVCYLGFVDLKDALKKGKQVVKTPRREHEGHTYAYELIAITYDGMLRSYLFNTPEAMDGSDADHANSPTSPTSPTSPRSSKLQHRRSLLAAQSLLQPRKTVWPREGFSDPGFFVAYHTFSLKRWLRTVACASIDLAHGVLIVGGAHYKHNSKSSDQVQDPLVFLSIEVEAPFYKKFNADGTTETTVDQILNSSSADPATTKYPPPIAYAAQTIRKLFERDNDLRSHSVHTVIAHETHGVLSLDSSGVLTSWRVSRTGGGLKQQSWDKEHLNYFARGKEYVDFSFQQFQERVQEFHANGTIAEGLIGLDNGRCVSMRFWTKDAILLGYENGVMIVLQIPELINILGDEPRVFASCLEFTNAGFEEHDEKVFVIEEITRMVRARVVGDRWILLSDQEDKALGEPTEQEISQMMGNENIFYRMVGQVSKYFEGSGEDPRRPKRQKLILVPKRTLCLYRMLRVPPVQLVYRKLESHDFASALSIATTYDLDTDVVHQYQWQQVTRITDAVIANHLGMIKDREWVLSSCLDFISDDLDGVQLLLEYGLEQTDNLMDDIMQRNQLSVDLKLAWVRAASSGQPLPDKASQELSGVQLTEREVLWCKYRWYFIKYLNRLSTYKELIAAEKAMRKQEEERTNKTKRSPKHSAPDPLDPLALEVEEPVEAHIPPIPWLSGNYSTFRDVDLSGQACAFASSRFIQGVSILFTRHLREVWPWRLAILDHIPETCAVDLYASLLPQVDGMSKPNVERDWRTNHPWRDRDWVEIPEFRSLVFGSADHEMDAYMEQQALTIEERKAAYGGAEAAKLDMAAVMTEVEEILPSPERFPATSERLSRWYVGRALSIDSNAGLLQESQKLIQRGIDGGVQGLTTIAEDLSILCRLLYNDHGRALRSPEAQAIWNNLVVDLSLREFSALNPAEVVSICLRASEQATIVGDIWRLVVPYLKVILPARWHREPHQFPKGQGLISGLDPENPMSYLYAYLLQQSVEHLPWVAEVVEASIPTSPAEQRIISNDMDLSWLTMACMYGCASIDQWEAMSRMIVCLPLFEHAQSIDPSQDKERRAALRRDIFIPLHSPESALSSSSSSLSSMDASRPVLYQQVSPLRMYPAFMKYAPDADHLQHALDTLEQHLTAAETLARYELPVRLSWFLENADHGAHQLQMVIKMARRASGGVETMGERFESEDEWMLLLEDLIRLRSGEEGQGVLGLVSEQDIYREFLGGVLSCGKFKLAKSVLFPLGQLPPLRLATAEKLVIDSSIEFYNNATSGNMNYGYLKMANDCLHVLPDTTNIKRELDLIEATHVLLSDYDLTTDAGAGLLPLQVRKTENRLLLVQRLLQLRKHAYRDQVGMLELAMKLTGNNVKERKQVEMKIIPMMIEAALKDRNARAASGLADRLMDLLKMTGSLDNIIKARGSAGASPRVRRPSDDDDDADDGDDPEGMEMEMEEEEGLEDEEKRSQGKGGDDVERVGTSGRTRRKRFLRLPPHLKDLANERRPWETFLQLAQSGFGIEPEKRQALVGYALASCPTDKIESVLEVQRSLVDA